LNRAQRWGGLTGLILAIVTLAIFLTINAFWLYRLDLTWLNVPRSVNMSVGMIIKGRLPMNYRLLIGHTHIFGFSSDTY